MAVDLKKEIGDGYSISFLDGRIYNSSGEVLGRVPKEDMREVKQQIKEAKAPDSHGGEDITFHEAHRIIGPYCVGGL